MGYRGVAVLLPGARFTATWARLVDVFASPSAAWVSGRRDLAVTPLGYLPDPFGDWVTMLYHIRIIRIKGPDGLLEVWADGTLR